MVDTHGQADWSWIWPALAVEALVVLVVGVVWLFVWIRCRPVAGPREDEFGSEAPAVVDLLVHGCRLSRAGAAATAIDLAARGFIDIDEVNSTLTLVHSRRYAPHVELTSFEQRVLKELHDREVDGVVPAEACDLGPDALSWRWWRSFGYEVGDEAQALGLVTNPPALTKAWVGLLVVLAVPATMLVVGTGGTGPSGSNDLWSWLAVLSIAVPIAAAYSLSHLGYVSTEEGRRVAGRWLGVGEMLSEATFDQQPPAAVRIWGQPLAYAVALGLAGHVAKGIPFGAENDRHAWSAAGGRWHRVRIRYRMWLPGWGRRPTSVLIVSLPVAAIATVCASAMFRWHEAAGRLPVGFLLSVVALAAAFEAIAAVVDLVATRTVEGEVIRLRERFPDFERGLLTIIVHRPRWFLVIDDGRYRLNALSIDEMTFDEISEGDKLRVVTTRLLRHLKAVTLLEPTTRSTVVHRPAQ